MCRTRDWGGMLLAPITILLIVYGGYCANRFTIFYWYWENKHEDQFVQGLPLNGKGFFYFATFNWLCALSIIAHLRASFADPGRITPGMKAPFQSEYIPIKSCEKCEGPETWKPPRAHHCKECGFCIFKMDHHCPWINNCVGQRNMKYFLQFVFYVGTASLYLAILMFIAFYNLLSATRTKTHMNKPGYPAAFIMCILAFVEGLLFAFFTFELLQEQYEAIEDNQSYIDDVKGMYGKQEDLFVNAQNALGIDFLWWLTPTHPELKINYFERLWTKKEVKRLYKEERLNEMEQEESDPDKKLFAVEQKRAQFEKKVMWVSMIVLLLTWVFVIQDILIDDPKSELDELRRGNTSM